VAERLHNREATPFVADPVHAVVGLVSAFLSNSKV